MMSMADSKLSIHSSVLKDEIRQCIRKVLKNTIDGGVDASSRVANMKLKSAFAAALARVTKRKPTGNPQFTREEERVLAIYESWSAESLS